MCILAICAAASSCSLALDLDALEKGSPVDSGAPPCTGLADCDDGVACTDDACLEDGSCANVPNNDSCGYLEICDPVAGCVPSDDECMSADDCDDGAACTEDACEDGQCANDPIPLFCEDEDPCIENEACDPAAEESDPVTGCLAGNETFCEQSGEPCMETACNSENGECADFLMETADNDVDTYLDADCGGDDCDDENGAVHPGAVEPCNGVDDDCDGLTDAVSIVGPVELDVADAIVSPSLAAADGLAAVVWQRDDEAVMAAVLDADGGLIDEPLDFTAEGGDGAIGTAPDVAAGDAGFWVVWVADGAATDPVATVAELTADGSAGTVTVGSPLGLGPGAATEVTAPRIAWDAASPTGSGWVAGYAAAYGDGSRIVQLETEDMHGSPAGDSFDVDVGTGAIDGLSLAVLGPNSYAIAYAREDAASGGDLEVFASEIELVSDAWANSIGFPLRISPFDDAEEVDVSYWPSLAVDGAGDWFAAFVDTDPGSILDSVQSDIALWDGALTPDLISEGAYAYREPSLAYDGGGYGLLYLARSGTYESLEFLSLDAAFAPLPDPYGGTNLGSSTGTDDTGEGRLVAVGAGHFAAVWVSRSGSDDHLKYLDFAVCGAGD
jgi:hypothetical protein